MRHVHRTKFYPEIEGLNLLKDQFWKQENRVKGKFIIYRSIFALVLNDTLYVVDKLQLGSRTEYFFRESVRPDIMDTTRITCTPLNFVVASIVISLLVSFFYNEVVGLWTRGVVCESSVIHPRCCNGKGLELS